MASSNDVTYQVASITSALATIPPFSSLSRRRSELHQLAGDVLAVSAGIRIACLVDAVLLDERQAGSFAARLEEIDRLRGRLVVFFEAGSEQTFVCSRRRLQALKIGDLDTLMAERSWVDIGSSLPQLLPRPPAVSRQCLTVLLDRFYASSASYLRIDMAQELGEPPPLPALAGFLLGYPVIYVSSGSQDAHGHSALGGCPLHVVAAELHGGNSARHRLISFSVPVPLCNDFSSDPEGPTRIFLPHVLDALQHDITAHLISTDQAHPWTSVSVFVSETVTLDRVAL